MLIGYFPMVKDYRFSEEIFHRTEQEYENTSERYWNSTFWSIELEKKPFLLVAYGGLGVTKVLISLGMSLKEDSEGRNILCLVCESASFHTCGCG